MKVKSSLFAVVSAVFSIAGLAIPGSAFATQATVVGSPTSWRLQDYVGGPVSVYFTPATTCTNGGLSFSASAAAEEMSRFFSLVLTAKVSGAQIGIIYDNTTCIISSFYAAP